MAKKEVTKSEENNIKKDVVKEIKEKVLSDLNKEIKTTIVDNTKKYKEELREEITEVINNEVLNSIQKEEKRILKGKSFSIFKRDIVIILLFGICLYFGYCLYDAKYFNFMKSECEKNGTCYSAEVPTEEGENKEPEIVKDKDWYINNYGYLLDNTQLNLRGDTINAYYLYSNDHQLNEIKPSYLLTMAYKQLSSKSIKKNSVSITVEGEDLRKAFEGLFGNLNNYKESTFTYDCLTFTYNKEKDRYVAENNKCSKSNKQILEVIDNIYEEGDILYIVTIATIFNEEEQSFYSFDNLFEPAVSNVSSDDISRNARKLNKYQYQFSKVDNNYYFDSITKLK